MASRAPGSIDDLSRLVAGLTRPRLATLAAANLFETDPPPEVVALGLPIVRFHVNDLEPASHPAALSTVFEGHRLGRAATSVRRRRADRSELLTALDLTEALGVVVLVFSDDADQEPTVPPVAASLSPILCFDSAGAIIDDTALVDVLGHQPGEHLNEGLLPLIHPDDVEAAVTTMGSILSNLEVSHHVRLRLAAADRSWRWVEIHATARANGPVVHVRSTLTDIDDEMRALDAIRHNERRLRALTSAMPIGVFRADEDGTLRFVNDRIAELVPTELTVDRDRWTALVHHTDQSRFELEVWRMCRARREQPSEPDARLERRARFERPTRLDGPTLDAEFRLPDPPPSDGRLDHLARPPAPAERTVRIAARAVLTEDGDIEVIGSVEETTERRRLSQELRHAATHDPLTGLANRAGLDEHLDRRLAFRAGSELTLLFVDLDGFKRINDSLGHRAGDRLLRTLAARVQAVLRPQDFVGRFGGDEFVIVSDQPGGVTGATALAQRVMDALREPVQLGGVIVRPQASIGVALSDIGSSTTLRTRENMLSDADSAMYAAKAAGRGRIRVADGVTRSVADLRWGIESALASVDHIADLGLRLAYQPIIEHGSGRIVGIESLLRWDHPTLGTVSPLDLIAIAEETGSIHGITDWALDQLAADLPAVRGWHETLAAVRAGINLSNIQLSRPGYARHHLDLIAQRGLVPADLVIEVTETALVEVAEIGEQTIRELHDAGVPIALDDFGAGYSSLEYLTRLPVDFLKLDRLLVNRMVDHPGARVVISGLVEICRDLGVTVIAEGVETDTERDLCLEVGVTELQGFLICRPLPLADLAAWATSAGRDGDRGATAGLDGAAGQPGRR